MTTQVRILLSVKNTREVLPRRQLKRLRCRPRVLLVILIYSAVLGCATRLWGIRGAYWNSLESLDPESSACTERLCDAASAEPSASQDCCAKSQEAPEFRKGESWEYSKRERVRSHVQVGDNYTGPSIRHIPSHVIVCPKRTSQTRGTHRKHMLQARANDLGKKLPLCALVRNIESYLAETAAYEHVRAAHWGSAAGSELSDAE